MECRKIRFEPANEPVEAGFSLRILLFVLIMKAAFTEETANSAIQGIFLAAEAIGYRVSLPNGLGN